MSSCPKILIGFADAISAPEVAWSLLDAGFHVLAFAKRGTHPALTKSRYIDVVSVSDPAESTECALSDLKLVIIEHDNPILMPLDDYSLWLAQQLNAGDEKIFICGATASQALVALDKRLQLAAAKDAGFNVPQTLELRRPDELQKIQSFPCILKPAMAARVIDDSLGKGCFFSIADTQELAAVTPKLTWNEPMLVQSLLTGVGEGLFGLAIDGRVVAWSGHRRIRMMNPEGSGSSACMSLEPSIEVLESAERFIKLIEWKGLFMIELLRDMDGKLWFMELNGRPWGSMALSRRMGFEYPAWSARYFIDHAYEPEVPQKRQQLLCRHLGREILHLAFVVRGPQSRSHQSWPSLRQTLGEMFAVGTDVRFYNWRKDDPMVFMADTLGIVAAQFLQIRKNNNARRSLLKRAYNRFLTVIELLKQFRARSKGSGIHLVKEAKSVLFLCYGNINRSALAHRYLTNLVGNDLIVFSCGFHSHAGRLADPNMVVVARKNGLSLDHWISHAINKQLVEQADVILAMEAKHLVRLYDDFPQAKGKSCLLGSLSKTGSVPLEISDPFGQPLSNYEKCFNDVTQAAYNIVRIIHNESKNLERKVQ